jgi:hypothetical protein
MLIEWHLDDQRMLNRDELTALVGQEGQYLIGLRFRESNALELQQRLLSDMGRVGLLSTMPFTFPVEVLMFTADVDGMARKIDLPTTASDGGVWITGRDGSGNNLSRLVLTESSIDEILSAIQKIDEGQICARAKDTLTRLRASSSFRSLLQRGLNQPQPIAKGSLSELKVPAAKVEGEQESGEEIVGLVVRNPGELPSPLTAHHQKSAAIIIVVNDLDHPSVVVSDRSSESTDQETDAVG